MTSRINKNLVSAFARALRTIRKEKELTQEQLAYGAKLHPTYIAFMEGNVELFKLTHRNQVRATTQTQLLISYMLTLIQ